MKDTFINDINDKGLSLILKREANIILASLNENSVEFIIKKECFKNVLNVVKAIEKTEPQNESEINFILDILNRLWNTGVLSPLVLKEEEFLETSDDNGYRRNKRYNDIYIDTKTNNSICNDNAFNISIRAYYSVDTNEQIPNEIKTLHKNHRVYISKGGVITGEYVEKCFIRQNVIDRHCFTIQSVVNIPVSEITDDNNVIYVVDHREPKLKVLQQFYDVPVNNDDNIANKHYNIRKFKKIK